MATAREVVTGAFRDRRVLGVNASLTASELSYGLDKLNQMLFAWRIDGIDMGHVSVEAGDSLDVPDDHLQTIRLSLAERLSAFADTMAPEDKLLAELGRNILRAQYFSLNDLGSDNPLSENNLSSERWG